MPGYRFTPLDLVDVFVYVVILGLTVQFLPGVLSESFLLTLLTAVLLKIVLEVVLRLKEAVVGRIRSAAGAPWRRVAAIATLVLILPGSKLVVLWLVDLVFGDAVRLGGFFAVTGLIIVLTLARACVRAVLAPQAADDR